MTEETEVNRDHVGIWEKRVPGRNNKCKGPEAEMCLMKVKAAKKSGELEWNNQEEGERK